MKLCKKLRKIRKNVLTFMRNNKGIDMYSQAYKMKCPRSMAGSGGMFVGTKFPADMILSVVKKQQRTEPHSIKIMKNRRKRWTADNDRKLGFL